MTCIENLPMLINLKNFLGTQNVGVEKKNCQIAKHDQIESIHTKPTEPHDFYYVKINRDLKSLLIVTIQCG